MLHLFTVIPGAIQSPPFERLPFRMSQDAAARQLSSLWVLMARPVRNHSPFGARFEEEAVAFLMSRLVLGFVQRLGVNPRAPFAASVQVQLW